MTIFPHKIEGIVGTFAKIDSGIPDPDQITRKELFDNTTCALCDSQQSSVQQICNCNFIFVLLKGIHH